MTDIERIDMKNTIRESEPVPPVHDERPARTVLLVDDDRTSLERIAAMLERRGYRTIALTSAPAALALVRDGSHPVDLVITDYRMPEMDGLEFSRALQRLSPALPLILITAHSDVESYLKALNAGVLEYINKPVVAQELLRIVAFTLDRRKDCPGSPG